LQKISVRWRSPGNAKIHIRREAAQDSLQSGHLVLERLPVGWMFPIGVIQAVYLTIDSCALLLVPTLSSTSLTPLQLCLLLSISTYREKTRIVSSSLGREEDGPHTPNWGPLTRSPQSDQWSRRFKICNVGFAQAFDSFQFKLFPLLCLVLRLASAAALLLD
jgi:hypothetical protein